MAFYYETSYRLSQLMELVRYVARNTFDLDICNSNRKTLEDIYYLSIGFERDCLKEDSEHKVILLTQKKEDVIKKFEHYLTTDRKQIVRILLKIRKTIRDMERTMIDGIIV